jgi:hypothetical protein
MRLVRRGLALCAGTVLALAAAELAVRWLLFSDSSLAARWGAPLRRPECLSDPNDVDYWKLQWILAQSTLAPTPNPDPEIGWLGAAEAGSYAHADEALLHGRRPVLLFGDSFAQCNTEPGECFQTLLERSELARDFALLNYGAGGYGLDQVYLLLRRVLPRFAGRKPFVVVGVLLDDDFNRSLLDVRCWPKPRAHLEQGVLRIDSPRLTDPGQYLSEHPLHVTSWFWRLFVYREGVLPRRWQQSWRDTGAPIEERVAVNRALLDAIAAELDAAQVEHVFLFFNGEQTLFDEPGLQWTVELARAFERETHEPCVWTTPCLRAGACGDPQRAHLFFGVTGAQIGHYTAWGNRIAFEALRQGILHAGEAPDLSRIEALCASGALDDLTLTTRSVELLGCRAQLSAHSREGCIRFQRAAAGEPRGDLWLRAGAGGPTTLEFELGGRYRRLRARAERLLEGPSDCIEGAVRVSFEVDGVQQAGWTSDTQAAGSAPGAARSIELPLEHASRLRITLGLAGASEACGWILLRDLVLE